MGNYNRGGGRSEGRGGSNFGNRGGGGRGSYSGGRDRGRPEMHKAVCDECGERCEVPFKPSGDKPVLCSSCFKKDDRGGRGDRRSGGGRDRGDRRDRREDRQMHKAICAECGRKCEVPFKPTGDKPVLCSECFGGGGGKPDPGKPYKPEQSSEKHDEILAKLDKILTLLQRTNPVKEITVMKAEKKEEKPKAKEAIKKTAPKKKAVKKAPAKKKTTKSPAKKKTAKPKKKAK